MRWLNRWRRRSRRTTRYYIKPLGILNMRASQSWLEQFKKQHPDRVHEGGEGLDVDAGADKAVVGTWLFTEQPPTLNTLLGMHWAKRERVKEDWVWRVKEQGADPIQEPVVVHMVRYTKMREEIDWDNAFGCYKLVLDALVHAGVLSDDNVTVIRDLTVDVEPPREDDVRTKVRVVHTNQ